MRGSTTATSEHPKPDAERTDRPARASIVATGVFVLVVATAGFANLEWWPLSGFHLFSHARSRHYETNSITGVDDGLAEHDVTLDDLGPAYYQTSTQIRSFPSWTPNRRNAACDAWVDGFEHIGRSYRYVRIYQDTFDVVDHRKIAHVLTYECGSDAP